MSKPRPSMAHMQALPSSRASCSSARAWLQGEELARRRVERTSLSGQTYQIPLSTISPSTPCQRYKRPRLRSRDGPDSLASLYTNKQKRACLKQKRNSRHGCSRPLVLRFHQMRRQQRRREHTTQRHPPRKIQHGIYIPVAVRSCRISIQMLRHKWTHDAE